MSLASVQQQLRASRLGDAIEIAPYLAKLCDSLARSMIGDRRPLALTVEAGAGTTDSSAAVSIGLIITELVINALKHAFPPGRQGEILVRYEAHGDDWRLSVSDNGTGQDLHERAHPGLGTSIVKALARQLNARVELSTGSQGTIVAIIREARESVPAGAIIGSPRLYKIEHPASGHAFGNIPATCRIDAAGREIVREIKMSDALYGRIFGVSLAAVFAIILTLNAMSQSVP